MPLRFKKSTRSGAQSECVEVGHTLRHIRDSKNPDGPLLQDVDVAQLILRFKKSARSGGQSACVEVGHTLRHVRDSKNPSGPLLHDVDVTRLIAMVRR